VRQANSTTPSATPTPSAIGHDAGGVTASSSLPHPYSLSPGNRPYGQHPSGLAEASGGPYEARGRAPAVGMPVSRALGQSSAYPYYSQPQPGTAPQGQWTPGGHESGVDHSYGPQSSLQGHFSAHNDQHRSAKLPAHRDGEG
jgi:hypothetical protein